MKQRQNHTTAILAIVAGIALLWTSSTNAQNAPAQANAGIANADRVNVPLTDPARPVVLKASLLNGSITVKAHAAKDVIVEARVREEGEKRSSRTGSRRIMIATTGLTVDEDNNEVRVSADSVQRTIDLTILVPARTSVNLRTVNDGDIKVTGIDGEIDVDDVNGEVTLEDVSGYAVAHALNGDVTVNFKSINPQKPMAFSSLNGDIDVVFPVDLKANVSIASDRGDVFSDFDIAMQARNNSVTVQDSRARGGKYRVQTDKTVRGTINGGGPEIQFKNFNGAIYIRKAGVPRMKESNRDHDRDSDRDHDE
jgi:DUF4097 and DUF4098 domain-containing protein YvlB